MWLCDNNMRLVILPMYPYSWASSRYRVYNYVPRLAAAGVTARIVPPNSARLPDRTLFIVRLLREAPKADAVLIQKRLLPSWLFRVLQKLNERLLFDFDDALFARPSSVPPESFDEVGILRRLEMTLRGVKSVIVGNQILAEYARRFAREVRVIPTPVDTDRLTPPATRPGNGPVVLGWIGSHENVRYLERLAPVFERLAHTRKIQVKVICDRPYHQPGIEIVNVPWSLETEVAELQSVDIGLMPLNDDSWSRGKCAFKALQFMSVGAPVVASPVGMSAETIDDGKNGFLADTQAQWEEQLARLIDDSALRVQLGGAARREVESCYSYDACTPLLLESLKSARREE